MGEKVENSALVRGAVARITYQDPEGRFTVARLEVDGSQEVTVVGEIFPLREGEQIKASGSWRMHPRFGLQLQVERWEKIEPATVEGIERYLGSGLIRGVGPAYARRLVSAFGTETLKVLSEEPHRLFEVEGIGRVRAQRILRAWEEQKGMREVMVFLQGHGVGSALALKIYRAFGTETTARIKEDPYCLVREVYGVGFLLADRIAGTLGISGDFPLRVQAGLLHVLSKFSTEGHCFVPLDLLKNNASVLLGVEEIALEDGIQKLEAKGDLILEEAAGDESPRVYARELYRAERRVAAALSAILSGPSCLKNKVAKGSSRKESGDPSDLLSPDLFNSPAFALEAEQREAVHQALRQKVLIITGGPGTGKTTLLTALLALFRRGKISFALGAPTGRAAKKMEEATGEEAKTIHRLLEYNPRIRQFQRSESHPLDVDVVIVDEASMVDLLLMDHLLRAIKPHSHLILLGDVDQLPSVGPGSVLRDLIDSGIFPVALLRRIFRQAGESLIVLNAHRILEGKNLLFDHDRGKRDFVFIAREREEDILETVKELVKERIPRSLSMESLEAIQVLSPMHRGLLGTVHLNRELQALLNPAGEPVERGGTRLRQGDKAMQLRNNYDKGVFNGDLGTIVAVDQEEGAIQIDFYGRLIAYDFDELDEISLAYATSIHKSQGSEYPVVVIPLHTSHYVMLHRSILYTAITRGKQMVVIVGNKKALGMAIRNVRVERRFTGLKGRLKDSGL